MTTHQDTVDHLASEGYAVVRGLLDPAVHLDPVIEEYHGVLDRLAHHLVATDHLADALVHLPFADRYQRIVAETGSTWAQWFDPALPQGDVYVDTPIWTGPAVFALLTSPVLLDLVEQVVGPEILANPVQHVRIKPSEGLVAPEVAAGQHHLGATSWHQDNGVVTPDADDTDLLTVWMPLTRATTAHGCLTVIPRSHGGGIHPHCPGAAAGLEIPETVLSRADAVALPLERGDVLLLHRRTAHASLPNTSGEIRWSLDLRYQPIGQPTGRAVHPGFVARSRRDPSTELHDPVAWSRSWEDARARLAVDRDFVYHRWEAGAAVCA